MDNRLIKPRAFLKPTSLLKDHLLDDMSSCSSNGFKSFPRQQCCSTVPFFHNIEDLKKQHKKQLNLKTTTSKSSPLSAIKSVIAAVKRFPFSGEKNKFKSSFLSRSFSKKILSKSNFWKRSKSKRKQIERWVLYDNVLVSDPELSDLSGSSITTSESKSKSWSGSDFTVSDECSIGNFSSEVKLNLPEGGNDVVEQGKKVIGCEILGVENGDVSTDSTACSRDGSVTTEKQWSNGEKEQLSPVSVLDCPFDDEVSSPFHHRLTRTEGTKKKLVMKIQKFDQLEPLNLSKRFSSLQDSINEPISEIEEQRHEEEEEKDKDEVEQKALELLNRTMDTLPSYNGFKLNSDELLLDFFRQEIINTHENLEKKTRDGSSYDEELLEEAENWINGCEKRDMFLEWNVHKNRQVYVKGMEKRGEWKILDEENKDVAFELEIEVFGALLDELLVEILG